MFYVLKLRVLVYFQNVLFLGELTIPLNSIQKIKIEPLYVLGHIYSISNIENYIKLDTKIEYFGDYGPEYGVNTAMQIHQLKSE